MKSIVLRGLSLVVLGVLSRAEAKDRNVLVLLADDMRFDSMSCAGSPVVKTPNLDRLAGEGIRFQHACVTTAICGVSRASLMTGQWMSRHGNPAMKAFKTPWAETYPGMFSARGYYVGHVGKWHNGAFPQEKFDFGRAYSGKHWMTAKDGSKVHVTKQNEKDALEFLRDRPKDRPFCLTVAFFAPHAEDSNPEQYLPQPESLSLYRDIEIPRPATATEESFRRLPPFLANDQNEGRNRWKWRFDTPEKYQKMMKNYFRLISEVDSSCGQILAALKDQGLLEETLIVFMADNGYFHGEHGLADKWYPYQESIRVPLILSDPRLTNGKRGKVQDEFALNVDIAPTLLAYAGLAAPAGMQGKDLAPLYLSAGATEWRKDFFYEHAVIQRVSFIPSSQALVEKEWKYCYWPDFNHEQLFHLSEDPGEERNLAREPEMEPKRLAMRLRMEQLREQAR